MVFVRPLDESPVILGKLLVLGVDPFRVVWFEDRGGRQRMGDVFIHKDFERFLSKNRLVPDKQAIIKQFFNEG